MTAEELELKRVYQRAACKRYAERHPERRKEQYRRSNKKTYLKHRQERLVAAKVYREKFKDTLNAKQKEYRSLHRELYRQKAKENYRRNKETWKKRQEDPARRYWYAVYVAKHRGLEWKISESDYNELITLNRCHYRNHPLNKTGVGLDRIDNSKGYVIGNVIPCCANCNRIKCHLLTYREMVEVGKVLDSLCIQKALEGANQWPSHL